MRLMRQVSSMFAEWKRDLWGVQGVRQGVSLEYADCRLPKMAEGAMFFVVRGVGGMHRVASGVVMRTIK